MSMKLQCHLCMKWFDKLHRMKREADGTRSIVCHDCRWKMLANGWVDEKTGGELKKCKEDPCVGRGVCREEGFVCKEALDYEQN